MLCILRCAALLSSPFLLGHLLRRLKRCLIRCATLMLDAGRSKGSSEQQALKSKLAEMRTQFQQLVVSWQLCFCWPVAAFAQPAVTCTKLHGAAARCKHL